MQTSDLRMLFGGSRMKSNNKTTEKDRLSKEER